MRIGIVTGVQEEADAFCTGQGRVEQIAHLSCRHLQVGIHDVVITCSGIGKVNAALAAATLFHGHRAELLMVIGTAGALRALADNCFVITEAIQGDYGAVRDGRFIHYSAGSWPIGVAPFEPMRACPLPATGLPTARIVTGDAFVECAIHGAGLADGLGGDLIDMETGAVAQVAARLGIPWAAIKATTDDANGASAGDFQINLTAAARRAAEAAEHAIALL